MQINKISKWDLLYCSRLCGLLPTVVPNMPCHVSHVTIFANGIDHVSWIPLISAALDWTYCTISTECSQGVTCDLWCSLAQVFVGVCDVWQPWKCSQKPKVFINFWSVHKLQRVSRWIMREILWGWEVVRTSLQPLKAKMGFLSTFLSQCLAEVIIPSVHIRFTQAGANGRTGRTTEMIQLY